MAKSSVATAKTAAKSIATDNPGRQASPVQYNDTIEYGLKAEKISNVTADDTIPTIVNDSDEDEQQTDESTMFLATSVTQEITQIKEVLQRDSCTQVKSHFDSLFQSIRKVMMESNFADSVSFRGYLCDGIGVPNESHNFNIFVVMSTSKCIATHPSTMARYWLKDLLASTWLNPKDFSEKIIKATEKTNVMQTSCDMKMCLSTGNFHDVIISNDVGYTVNILPAIKINSTVYIPSEQNTSIAPPYLWEKAFYHEERKFYETVNPILRDSMKTVRFILNGLGSFEHFPGNGLITIANHISNREKVHSSKNDDENLTFYVIEMLRDICKHLHWRWLPYWFEPSVNLLEHIDAVLCGRMHVNVVAITSQQSRFHEAIHSICNQV